MSPCLVDYDAHRAETMQILQAMVDYSETMEAQLMLAMKQDSTRLRKEFGVIKKKELEHFCSKETCIVSGKFMRKLIEYEKHALRFQHDLPSQLRYSIIIFLYIVFETRSRAMCKELRRRRPQKIHKSLEDYLEKGAKKKRIRFSEGVRHFLEKEVSDRFSNSKIWSDILCLEKARHCIAHTNGFIPNFKDSIFLEQLAGRNLGFEIGGNGYALIQARFCQRMQASVLQFFKTSFEYGHFGPEKFISVPMEDALRDPYYEERVPENC